jgi:prepilin-type N-terminal cleavage/methylation domain-containing protein
MRPLTRRPGFTLIELLIVVVIIGILAAIAIPKFQTTKGKANAAALRSDLRNLATAQESYIYEHGAYAAVSGNLSYSGSPGVTITIEAASPQGWAARATHPSSYPLTCAMYVGNVTPPVPATVEGVIACQ